VPKIKVPAEAWAGQTDFAVLKPNVYNVKVKSAVHRPDRNDLNLVFTVIDGTEKGSEFMEYVNYGESSLWRYAECVVGFGLYDRAKRSPTVDPELDAKKLAGKSGKVRTKIDNYEGEERTRVARYLAPAASTAPVDEPDEDEDEDDEDEEDGVDLDAMDRAELKKFIKEEELDIRVTKSMDDDAIRDAIGEALDEEEE
jgi:hypothetical protein